MNALFLIELASGEVVEVTAMYDDFGDEVEERSEARQFGVRFPNGCVALLRLHPESEIEKIERH